MSLILPTSKVPAVSINPKFLIIYGRPKSGNKIMLFGNLITEQLR